MRAVLTSLAMGSYLVTTGPKDAEAMQGKVVRMAGSLNQEGRMVKSERILS